MVKFGIVIPTFNRPELLVSAIESLRAQAWEQWQAVVVNDASTVDYKNVENRYLSEDRISFLTRDKNGGINAARNMGLDFLMNCQVDFITFLDDDDVFSPDFFSDAIETIRKNPGYGWYMSNNYGEVKVSTRHIPAEQEFDWIDDYIYGKFRGDKAHLFSAEVMNGIRLDERFRSSNRWPFFIDISQKTKIFAYPHASVKKAYLDGGITKSSKKILSPIEIYGKFYKHFYVIKKRPLKLLAYKYFFLELFKSPARLIKYWLKGNKPC